VIIARIRDEEKDSKWRPDKSMRRAPEPSSQSRRRDTLTTEVMSPPKAQSVRGDMGSSHPCGNKMYFFKDEHVVSLFKLLQKSNRLNQRSDALKRKRRLKIPTAVYIT